MRCDSREPPNYASLIPAQSKITNPANQRNKLPLNEALQYFNRKQLQVEAKRRFPTDYDSGAELSTFQQLCDQNLISLFGKNMAYYQRDQLSIKTRSLLADYLADLILISESVECFRNALAEVDLFDGVELFRFLDRHEKGYLTPADFAHLISTPEKKILHYAFGWFDVAKVGEITKTQFLQFLYPRKNQELRELLTARILQPVDPHGRQASLGSQVSLFRELVVQIMKKETGLIPVRRCLMNQEDYTLQAVLNSIDNEGRGWIGVQDVHKFIKNYDIDADLKKVKGLLNAYDLDMNGKISLTELEWLIEGLERHDGKYRSIIRESHKRGQQSIQNCKCQKKAHGSQKSGSKLRAKKQKNKTTSKKQQPKTYQQRNSTSKKDYVNSQRQRIAQDNTEARVISQEYEIMRKKFEIIEKENLEIQRQLLAYDQQMELENKLELQAQLHSTKQRKEALEEEKKLLFEKQQNLKLLRKKQQLVKIKEIENEIKKNIQQKKRIQLETQNEKIRLFEVQRIRLQEEQRLRDIENQRLRAIQSEKKRALLQSVIAENTRIPRQAFQNQEMIRARMERQISIRQAELSVLQGQSYRTDFNWKAEQRLHDLYSRSQMSPQKISSKQNQYLWKYNNYCLNLAQVADPLGIKKHIAETDKYLQKSKELREEIKKDRAYSLGRNPSKVINFSQQSASNYKIMAEKTPMANKNNTEATNKKTEATKLNWT